MQKHVPMWPALFGGEVAPMEGDRHRAAWSRLRAGLKSWLPLTRSVTWAFGYHSLIFNFLE